MTTTTGTKTLIQNIGFVLVDGTSYEIKHPENPNFILRAVKVHASTKVSLYSMFQSVDDSEYSEYELEYDDEDTTPEGFNKDQHISIHIDTKDPHFFLTIGGAVVEQFKSINA